jgi:predicted transcriptional regulator
MSYKDSSINLKIAVLLARIIDELHEVNEKLNSLIALNGKLLESQKEQVQKPVSKKETSSELKLAPDVMALLSLPMSLRKTVMALYKLEEATAKEIANETKRLRAVESASANQLVRLGYLKKKREGRNVYFYIHPSSEATK